MNGASVSRVAGTRAPRANGAAMRTGKRARSWVARIARNNTQHGLAAGGERPYQPHQAPRPFPPAPTLPAALLSGLTLLGPFFIFSRSRSLSSLLSVAGSTRRSCIADRTLSSACRFELPVALRQTRSPSVARRSSCSGGVHVHCTTTSSRRRIDVDAIALSSAHFASAESDADARGREGGREGREEGREGRRREEMEEARVRWAHLLPPASASPLASASPASASASASPLASPTTRPYVTVTYAQVPRPPGPGSVAVRAW